MDDYIGAGVVVLYPVGGILKGDIGDFHPSAGVEIEDHGTTGFGPFHEPERVILQLPTPQLAEDVDHQLLSLSIDDSGSTDGDVLLFVGDDERTAHTGT